MNERYDRSACYRITPTQHNHSGDGRGWNLAESFHLPESVTDSIRIGMGPMELDTTATPAPVIDDIILACGPSQVALPETPTAQNTIEPLAPVPEEVDESARETQIEPTSVPRTQGATPQE